MAKKPKSRSRLARALLETADDMRRAGVVEHCIISCVKLYEGSAHAKRGGGGWMFSVLGRSSF